MRNFFLFSGLFLILLAGGFLLINQEVLNPQKRAAALIRRGRLYLEQAKPNAIRKAIDEFTQAISLYPRNSYSHTALFHLGVAYEKLGMMDIASEKFQELASKDLEPDLSKKVQFKIAKMKILRARSEEGKSGLLVLLSQTRDHKLRSQIYTELGKYYCKRKKFLRGQRNFKIALSENPANYDARLHLAKSLITQGKHQAAYSIYDNYLSLSGEIDQNRAKVAAAYRQEAYKHGLKLFHAKNYQKAISIFEIVHRKFASTKEAEEALFYTGVSYFRLKNYFKAVDFFDKAIRTLPKDHDEAAHIKKGECYYHLKKYKFAAKTFLEATRKFPEGRYNQVAKDWLNESKRAMQEEYEMKRPEVKFDVEKTHGEEPVITDRINPNDYKIKEIEEPKLDEEGNITP